jgi:hypothetical protein
MPDVRGPAIDPEAFRVVGHCCSIRLPVLETLTEEGLRFEFTPQVRAELVATGMHLPDGVGAPPVPDTQQEPAARTAADR